MLLNSSFAGVAGLLAHQIIFIRGEWHLLAPRVAYVHFILSNLVLVAELYARSTIIRGLIEAFALCACYLTALFCSIAIYRVWFHRLKGFPGPRLAAASKLWHVWKCRDSRNHLILESLHQQYGPVVRTGIAQFTSSDNASIADVCFIQVLANSHFSHLAHSKQWTDRRAIRRAQTGKWSYHVILGVILGRNSVASANSAAPWLMLKNTLFATRNTMY